ncbi:hypothetical protein B296_00010720 [Ensete ventricosum]|uniref:Uncharacterized protein n=1 Tax=Ensete ventricosum TaxID=4639 RepID=A0A426ZTH1_ENSVE|nr:hypothetical protein B296_00010720 [Ensete ventricosum]
MASASSHCPFRHMSFLHAESRFRSAESGYFGTQFMKSSTSELIIYQNSVTTYLRKLSVINSKTEGISLLQGCREVAALPDIGDFFWEKDPTPILDMVDMPIQLKNLSHKVCMAVARDINGKKNRVVTVISNWTTMAGQVYEAMSNAGQVDPSGDSGKLQR